MLVAPHVILPLLIFCFNWTLLGIKCWKLAFRQGNFRWCTEVMVGNIWGQDGTWLISEHTSEWAPTYSTKTLLRPASHSSEAGSGPWWETALGVHGRELQPSLWGARGRRAWETECRSPSSPGAPQQPQGRWSSFTVRTKVKPISLSTQGCCAALCLSQFIDRITSCTDTGPATCWRTLRSGKTLVRQKFSFPLLPHHLQRKGMCNSFRAKYNWSPSTFPSLSVGSESKLLSLSECHRIIGNVTWDTVCKLLSTCLVLCAKTDYD